MKTRAILSVVIVIGLLAACGPSEPETVIETVEPVRATVTSETLEMRAGPSVFYRKLGPLTKGDELVVIAVSSDQNWIKVRSESETGWVLAVNCEVRGDLSGVEIVDIPTKTPQPTRRDTRPPELVHLEGHGQTATDEVDLPSAISAIHFTHRGSGNFAVWAYSGGESDLLVNTIGSYEGTRLIVSGDPVMFDITAGGRWTVDIEMTSPRGTASFAGTGDDVSGPFDPPRTGAWEISHDGDSNFAVWIHCSGGSDLIQNEIGAVEASTIIQFPEGPCLWEVTADGDWSLRPR